ncbi:hypothetical protein [Mycolicibacterium celeriflavum]|uniref:hypothetical protein n=1 Tax=Mycolicibacterium celeriflavum TaxID=1249101 RepID=UPI003CE9A000
MSAYIPGRMRARKLTTGAALMVGAAVALAFPSVATAESVWDIGEYDSCTQRLNGIDGSEGEPIAQEIENQKWCCYTSGGVWTATQGCVAPPVESAGSPSAPNGPKLGLPTVRVKPPIVAPPSAPVIDVGRPEVRPALG